MFPIAYTPLFLALSKDDSPMLLWLIVGGIMALGPVLRSYIGVYEWFKGSGIDTSKYVTHEQLAEVKANRDAQLHDTLGFIKDRLKALDSVVTALNNDMPAIHRALGKLEGHDEAAAHVPARRR